MASVRPSLLDLSQLVEPLDAAELAVARALATLDDGWTVYIRPRIGLDVPSFLAVHDLNGLCTIEVADWRPGTHRQAGGGAIEYRDNFGAWHLAADEPRFRAGRTRAMLYDQFFALPADGGEPTEAVRAAVVLPHFTDAQARELLQHPDPDDPERAVALWGGDDLRGEIGQIVSGIGCAHPNPESIRRLREHVVASEVAVRSARPAVLGEGVAAIAENGQDAPFRRFRGPAGSGKSFGAAARAARLAAEGKRVLLLSFNVTLANRLRTMSVTRCREVGANPTLVTATNFHSFCTRVVQDAERAGIHGSVKRRLRWSDAIVRKAEQAFEKGFERRYDAILVDEGQDYKLDWWNMLRHHVLARGGEMLLLVDPTQDVYDKRSWVNQDQMLDAGFFGPWSELPGSYRLPVDMVPLANDFATRQVKGEIIDIEVAGDYDRVVGTTGHAVRTWHNVAKVRDIGRATGEEVVRLLREHPELEPRDIVYLCEYHHDGVAAARVIEAAGHPVHHIFSRDPDDPQRRRRYRFWPDADAVKGVTPHGFKGWETTALVMSVGMDARSKRLAFVAMTRAKVAPAGATSYVSVINADPRLASYQSDFSAWAPPQPSLRVG